MDKKTNNTNISNSNEELEAISTTTIKHPWFTGLKALMDMFSERVPFQERVRIVVDYDPQQTHTKIVIYRPKGTCLAKGNEFTFDPEYTVDPDAAPLESLGKFFLEVNEEERTMTIIPNAAPLQLTGKEAMALVAMIMEQTRSWSE